MISLWVTPPDWFCLQPATKARDLGSLSCFVVVTDCFTAAGHATVKYDPDSLLDRLGSYLPVGIGPAHQGYLEVCHVLGSFNKYRVFFRYIEDYPPPVLLWECEGYPPFISRVKRYD